MRWGTALIIVAALTACDDRVESRFPNYAAIPEQSGIWTWLPVFFPTSASEIEITTNLDLDLFYADFDVKDDDERARFEAALGEENVVKSIDAAYKSWCKAGKTIWNREVQAKPFFITNISAIHYQMTNDIPACCVRVLSDDVSGPQNCTTL